MPEAMLEGDEATRTVLIEFPSAAAAIDAYYSDAYKDALTTLGDDKKIEQITKQLNKLIEVVKVVDLTEGEHVERELMLVKLRAVGAQRAEIKRTADIFRGQIVDATESAYTVQLVGGSSKLDAFLRAVGELSILEVVRSGVSGLARGEKVVSV